jgi:tripartite-type tricarboxylate transporter receptor subunit TctC
MSFARRSIATLLSTTAASLCAPFVAQAQEAPFPTRPVRIIVPVAPGGGIDLIARVMAPKLGEALAQSVVVENRSGGAMVIGTAYAAKAAADGHTLVLNNSSLAANATLQRKLPYDTLRDLAPISLLAKQPSIVVVHPSMPVKTVGDLLRLARQRPGQISYGTGGSGTSLHLAAALLEISGKVDFLNVVYKGAGPVLTDLVGGHIQMAVVTIGPALPFVKSNRLRALAVTDSQRVPTLPDLPTVAESGLSGYEFVTWYGLSASGGTPSRVVDQLNRAVVKAVGDSEVRNSLSNQGLRTVTSTPAEFAAYIKAEVDKWARVIKLGNIQPE